MAATTMPRKVPPPGARSRVIPNAAIELNSTTSNVMELETKMLLSSHRLNGASSAQREAHAAWGQERNAAFKAIFPDPLSRLTVRTDEERLEALIRFFHARMHAGHSR